MPDQLLTPAEFAQTIKAKYPDYASVPDGELAARMLEKYPEYKSRVRMADFSTTNLKDASGNATVSDWGGALQRAAASNLLDVGKGALKGAASTVVGLGRLAHLVPGVDAALGPIPASAENTLGLDATNTAQRVGKVGEQAAEFLIPSSAGEKAAATVTAKLAPYFRNAPRLVGATSRVAPRMATQAATAAGVAAAQGGSPEAAAIAGAAGPLVGAGSGAGGDWIGSKAAPLVRAAIKPTVTAMKSVAGASYTGIEAQAKKFVQFVLDNNITTADQARAIVVDAEKELQQVLSLKNAPTDAPQRAIRYLSALEHSASKQALPAADIALIRNAAAEVLATDNLGKDVITMVPKPHPTLVDPSGKPITVLVPQTSRALRTDVSAQEALGLARANSKWDTTKAWGEQKGAQMEASKTVERAQRDAIKAAVPETQPILAREGQAIQAAKMLDRMQFRQGNRDAVSLPAHVVAAGEIASGKLPLLAFAANWLRNNQMKAGIWAYRLSNAIAKQDVQGVAAILNRFGVGVTAQAASPAK